MSRPCFDGAVFPVLTGRGSVGGDDDESGIGIEFLECEKVQLISSLELLFAFNRHGRKPLSCEYKTKFVPLQEGFQVIRHAVVGFSDFLN